MEIKLIEALDYKKVKNLLQEYVNDESKVDEIITGIKNVEKMRKAEVVSTAGRLSRFPGDVIEVLLNSEEKTFVQNNSFINRVISMKHRSITEHDYLVFALKDVSIIVEQMIIAERIASFTIKSRREVDFSNVGYYVPDFHDNEGNIINDNKIMKNKYMEYMDELFSNYSKLVDNGINIEDARFCLPYCYNSNILMAAGTGMRKKSERSL